MYVCMYVCNVYSLTYLPTYILSLDVLKGGEVSHGGVVIRDAGGIEMEILISSHILGLIGK